MVNCRVDHARAESCALNHLGQGSGPGLERVQDGAQGSAAHQNSRPIWKTATASVQATTSCMPMPNNVQRKPTSRRCAANVATQGVYASKNTKKASTAGTG